MLLFRYTRGGLEGSEVAYGRSRALSLLSLWSGALTVYLTQGRSKSANLIAGGVVLASAILIQWHWMAVRLHVTPLQIMDWWELFGMVASALVLHFLLRRTFSKS
jgi:hypothetical protein